MLDLSKNTFEVDFFAMTDFCRTLERCDPKNTQVFFSFDGQTFKMYSQTHLASVFLIYPATGEKKFSCGVEASKFMALWKKLYAGSKITFKITKEQLTISEDNISVKFPLTDLTKHYTLPQFKEVSGSEADELVRALSVCEAAVGVCKQLSGVLIDNTPANVGRVLKFGDVSTRLVCCNKFSFGPTRFVVPDEFCSAVAALAKYSKTSPQCGAIKALLLSETKIGASLSSGVFFYMPLLHDAYPVCYNAVLQVLDAQAPLPVAGRRYLFDLRRISEVMDLVSSVIGQEESMLVLEVEGLSAVEKRPVFKISSRTHTGCEVSERIECIDTGPTDMPPYRVNKSKTILALKAYEGPILLTDQLEQFLVLQDDTGKDLTFLYKVRV